MVIIISNFNNDYVLNDDIVFLSDICEIRHLNKDHNIVFLLNKYVSENGLIDEKYMFEELFISLNCDAVISNCINDKLIEICKFYNIPLYEL